jgi:hypothetical protein
VVVPLVLVLVYVTFTVTSNATGTARVLAALFMFVALAMWLGFRRLRVHAAAARYAGIGEPEPLLALADEELARRWLSTGTTSLQIYRAMAFNQLGRPADALAALKAAGVRPGQRKSRSWQLLWGAADVEARTRLGDATAARATYAQVVKPFTMILPGRGIELIAAECEARVLLAERDAAGAKALVTPRLKDIRLGPGARAQLYAILAACEAKLGDADAAAAAKAMALELAPQCALLP